MATPSRDVAQILASTTSKRGLNREAWAEQRGMGCIAYGKD